MFRSLNNIIESISTNHKLKKYFIYDQIQLIWLEHIDKTIQSNTQLINFKNDVLIIETSNPLWKTELGLQKDELLEIINKNLKTTKPIKDIRFI